MSLWQTIPGHAPYQATRCGRIRNPTSQHGDLTHHLTHSGYPRVWLQTDQQRPGNYSVHRLVALAYLGPPPTTEHTQVEHLDGQPQNCHVDNLRWATPLENTLRARWHGTLPCPLLTQEENRRSRARARTRYRQKIARLRNLGSGRTSRAQCPLLKYLEGWRRFRARDKRRGGGGRGG